jgi:hypothetical protein
MDTDDFAYYYHTVGITSLECLWRGGNNDDFGSNDDCDNLNGDYDNHNGAS